MEQIKYQGYARDRGFNPIQLSSASVDAIGQQGNAMLRQMRENQSAERDTRNAFQSQVEQNQRTESQNRSENFQFETRSRDMYQQGVLQNMKTQANNDQIQYESTQKALVALSAFSGTMGKMLIQRKEKKDESEKKQGYRDVMLNGANPKKQAAIQAGVQQLQNSHTAIQGAANSLQDSGAAPEIVNATRKLSKAYQVGMAMAKADMASLKLDGWLAEKFATDNETQIDFNGQIITPAKHLGPDQRAAISDVLIKQFVAEQGLLDIDPELVAPALLKMRQVEQKYLDKERDNYIKAENENSRNQINMQFDTGLQTDPIRAWNFGSEQ